MAFARKDDEECDGWRRLSREARDAALREGRPDRGGNGKEQKQAGYRHKEPRGKTKLNRERKHCGNSATTGERPTGPYARISGRASNADLTAPGGPAKKKNKRRRMRRWRGSVDITSRRQEEKRRARREWKTSSTTARTISKKKKKEGQSCGCRVMFFLPNSQTARRRRRIEEATLLVCCHGPGDGVETASQIDVGVMTKRTIPDEMVRASTEQSISVDDIWERAALCMKEWMYYEVSTHGGRTFLTLGRFFAM